MIKEKDVLKAIVESRRADGRTYYEDIEKYLGINRRFLKDHIFSLKEKGYVDIFLKAIFKLLVCQLNTGILKSFNAGINYVRFIFLFFNRSFILYQPPEKYHLL